MPHPRGWQSERLCCVQPSPDDADDLFDAIECSRDQLWPWMDWARDQSEDVDLCRAVLERFAQAAESAESGGYMMAMKDRKTGALVGGTSFHNIQHETHQAEIGYWIRTDRTREGLCTEAMRAHISWGLAPQDAGGWGLRRIEAFCAGRNGPSVRVLEKAGMRRESCAKEQRWIEGIGWDNSIGFGVLAAEWDVVEQAPVRRSL